MEFEFPAVRKSASSLVGRFAQKRLLHVLDFLSFNDLDNICLSNRLLYGTMVLYATVTLTAARTKIFAAMFNEIVIWLPLKWSLQIQ